MLRILVNANPWSDDLVNIAKSLSVGAMKMLRSCKKLEAAKTCKTENISGLIRTADHRSC